MALSKGPTYGDLLEMLECSERKAAVINGSTAQLLTEELNRRYPSIYVGRPGRFLDTVKRIAAPTIQPLTGKSKLEGTPLKSYLKRQWSPRIRNTATQAMDPFPEELTKYGLSEELLHTMMKQFGETKLSWSLNCIPTVEFYRILHQYLKRWPVSHSMSKVAIGKFYIAIDEQLKLKGSRPGCVYRFIDRLVSSAKASNSLVEYGKNSKLENLQQEVESLSTKLQQKEEELKSLREQLTAAEEISKGVISDQIQFHQEKYSSFKKLCTQEVDKKIEELLVQNQEFAATIDDLQEELEKSAWSVNSVCCSIDEDQSVKFCFKTMDGGKQYSSSIRNLYYSLLADQISPAKIRNIIKVVLKCFVPTANLDQLRLPSEGCASYMRRQELKTVSMAHKAAVVTNEITKTGQLHLNSDGTTKSQKKIQGVAINGLTVSVNEVSDGSADRIVEDISKELERLRNFANALHMPHANEINWTLINSSTSDSAATQKRFNKLIKEQKELDQIKFGPARVTAAELVENFCAMHLGVNLRKAFLDGTKNSVSGHSNERQQRHYHQTDSMVYEFCKIFGKHGVPEYGCGITNFPTFLELMSQDDEKDYYQNCSKISLDRQVGSRYFVTASNSGKLLFLQQAAIDYLQYTGKDKGNKLEQEVFRKLQDVDEISQLKADALMFYHVYADLVMLTKSNELEKSAFDMNEHYHELSLFLKTIEKKPSLAMNKNAKVFQSEGRLYDKETKTNHRLHLQCTLIEERLFQNDEWDEELLFPLLSAGTAEMHRKLNNYAKDHLPEGKYWNPDSDVRSILQKLKPSNDLCESILGLNDYLTTAVPNMLQLTRSNLVEIKKNNTISWYDSLSQEERDKITSIAVRNRVQVMREYRCDERAINEQQKAKMKEEKEHQEALKVKKLKQNEKLCKLQLIVSVEELTKTLAEVDAMDISSAKKMKQKLGIIKDQITIRKKVLHQKITIPFSVHGKNRSLQDITKELFDHMQTHSVCTNSRVEDPAELVGKQIFHRFLCDGREKWYRGNVVRYSDVDKTHEVVYIDEDMAWNFNLMEDLLNEDLIILTN